jgi:hypothetical protein
MANMPSQRHPRDAGRCVVGLEKLTPAADWRHEFGDELNIGTLRQKKRGVCWKNMA